MAVIHLVALELYLYWHFFWFDIFMHLFGGSVVALGVYTLADLRLYGRRYLTPVYVVGFVCMVAVLWEIFEWYAGVPVESDFLLDTMSDLLMGLSGGHIGYLVGRSLTSVDTL
jgi:hypothetical protein